MQVKYRIPVEHRGKAPAGIKFEWGGATYKFSVRDERLDELEVIVPGFPTSALPKIIQPSAADPLPTISIPEDPVWPVIERRLMFVEGAVAMLGLKQFDFERRTIEWIPENDTEREATDLFSLKVTMGVSQESVPVAYDMFARSLIVADELASIEIALNFSRRGREDLSEGRYIEAIYDFYFVLETLFAGGAFKKNEVLQRFLGHDELVKAINEVQRSLLQDRALWQHVSLEKRAIYAQGSVREVLSHVIQTRGVLHHHSGRGAKAWHPNQQAGYRVEATFLAYICFEILNSRVFSRIYSEDAVQRFSSISFVDDNGRGVKFAPLEMPES